jgi:hypothetical protein
MRATVMPSPSNVRPVGSTLTNGPRWVPRIRAERRPVALGQQILDGVLEVRNGVQVALVVRSERVQPASVAGRLVEHRVGSEQVVHAVEVPSCQTVSMNRRTTVSVAVRSCVSSET